MIKFNNTLTKKLEEFHSIKKNKVTIYSCGPTVYDNAHIGNLSTNIFVDILKKYLAFRGYKINDVMNITDVDDKTIKNSIENNQNLIDYTEHFTELFFEDLQKLNIAIPKKTPLATKNIAEMITIIEKLIEKDFAYQAEDKSVYFKINKFQNYGKLSGFDTNELKTEASGRIEADEYDKENASDFVLWKAWTESDGDTYWESPWGNGRPGWHIECSAMSTKYLGNTIDIHTGGEDLVFPHHENEIAQTEALTDQKFVNYWLHRAYLKVDGKKMSKSLGNFYTLQDILEKIPDPMAFRYLIATSHYKMPLNFTFESLRAANTALNKIRNFVEKLELVYFKSTVDIGPLITKTENDFEAFMDNDLNTPNAIASWFEFQNKINQLINDENLSKKQAKRILKFIKQIDAVWGFMLSKKPEITVDEEKIEKLIIERNKFRSEKNFEQADRIRDELLKMGIEIKDQGEETIWE
jgi:cysteinyl-tRNA synthetase